VESAVHNEPTNFGRSERVISFDIWGGGSHSLKINNTVVWDVKSYSLVDSYRRFGGTFRLRGMQQVPPKCSYLPTRLCSVTSRRPPSLCISHILKKEIRSSSETLVLIYQATRLEISLAGIPTFIVARTLDLVRCDDV
jgi:hypothetical protein